MTTHFSSHSREEERISTAIADADWLRELATQLQEEARRGAVQIGAETAKALARRLVEIAESVSR